MKKPKCECPVKSIVPFQDEFRYSAEEKIGMNHEPNQCQGTHNIRKYKRESKEMFLCSCCVLIGDIEI